MNGSALDLRGPAGDLWRAIGRTVREELTTISTTGTPYAIGGGSILAARWKHRHSYDIDLLVAPDAPIGMLARANNPAARFEPRLRAIGGEPRFYPDEKLWIVEFDDGKRKLDVLARAPLLEKGQQDHTIDGRLENTLSNAQILRGKLERADEPLARDVFDIIKASRKDPEGLEAAVNAVGRDTATRIAHAYHWAGPTIAADAQIAMAGVPANEDVEPRELGHRAAHAVSGALYTKCRIETRNKRIEVTTRTANRGDTTSVIEPDNADDYFERTGLNAYLDPQGPGAKALREYARNACRAERDRTVFEADADGVRAWRTARAGMNLEPGNAADAAEDRRNR